MMVVGTQNLNLLFYGYEVIIVYYTYGVTTSGDENHLCGASLRQSQQDFTQVYVRTCMGLVPPNS